MSKTKNLFNREVWVELKPDTIQDGREYVTTSSGDSYMGSVKYRSVPRRIKTTLKNALQITGAFALTSIVLGGDKVSADSTNVPLNPKNIIIEERFFYPQPKDTSKNVSPKLTPAQKKAIDKERAKGRNSKDMYFVGQDGNSHPVIAAQSSLKFSRTGYEIKSTMSGLIGQSVGAPFNFSATAQKDRANLEELTGYSSDKGKIIYKEIPFAEGKKDILKRFKGTKREFYKFKDFLEHVAEKDSNYVTYRAESQDSTGTTKASIPFLVYFPKSLEKTAGTSTVKKDSSGQGRTGGKSDSSGTAPVQPKEPSPVQPIISEESKKLLGLIVGAHAGQVSGVEAGIQYGKFAFLGEYNFSAADEHIETKYGKVTSTGMQSVRSLDHVDFKSIGLDVEREIFKNISLGAGLVYWDGKIQRSAATQDIHTQKAIEPPKYDQPGKVSEWGVNVKGVYSQKIGKNTALEGVLKFNTQKGYSIGARVNYHFRQ